MSSVSFVQSRRESHPQDRPRIGKDEISTLYRQTFALSVPRRRGKVDASVRTSAQYVLLPQFAQAVVFQPGIEFSCIEPSEFGFLLLPINHDHFFRLEIIEQLS